MYRCTLCGAEFASGHDLTVHLYEHHQRGEVMIMDRSQYVGGTMGMQCYQNGPDPVSKNWELRLARESFGSRWDI
jgi:hypothetical protein